MCGYTEDLNFDIDTLGKSLLHLYCFSVYNMQRRLLLAIYQMFKLVASIGSGLYRIGSPRVLISTLRNSTGGHLAGDMRTWSN